MMCSDVREIEKKLICCDCIGEEFLSQIISNEGKEKVCSYCAEAAPSLDLIEVSDRVEAAFADHFTRTPDEPNGWQYSLLRDKKSDYDWEREGQQATYAIMDAAQVREEVAQDIQAILEYRHADFEHAAIGIEDEFSADSHYEEIMSGDSEWQVEWRNFEKLIKTEARFFSRTAASLLGKLFDQIDGMKTSKGARLVVDAGPETTLTRLFRARVFQSDAALEKAMARPDLELAAPPSRFASAGRMNAKGISVFYGATTPEIALAEVRPPVGSQVAIASFEITRPLRLLDLTAFAEVHERGSIFDPGYAERLRRMMFLRTLSTRMARPVMPDDQETEYLPTQAIADFLATEGKVPLDGILFPSVQVGGTGNNVVLLHKAARCAELDIPEGTEIEARTYSMYEDGPEADYSVTEQVPAAKADNGETEDTTFGIGRYIDDLIERSKYDPRPETLRIEQDSLNVHQVNAVKIDTTAFKVHRRRREKQTWDF